MQSWSHDQSFSCHWTHTDSPGQLTNDIKDGSPSYYLYVKDTKAKVQNSRRTEIYCIFNRLQKEGRLYNRWYHCYKCCHPLIEGFSVYLNNSLGCKSYKNWSIVTNIGYVFHGSNHSLYTKNCEHMLDTFYRAVSKSWIFFFAITSVKIG